MNGELAGGSTTLSLSLSLFYVYPSFPTQDNLELSTELIM